MTSNCLIKAFEFKHLSLVGKLDWCAWLWMLDSFPLLWRSIKFLTFRWESPEKESTWQPTISSC